MLTSVLTVSNTSSESSLCERGDGGKSEGDKAAVVA